MELTFAPRNILQIDDARIIYRNFRGEGGKFNREGDRNFALVIPTEDMADALVKEGWNVKIKPPRDDEDSPFMYLPVKVKFTKVELRHEHSAKVKYARRGPQIYLVTGNYRNKLDEEAVPMLDEIDISSVNLDIRPYDWEINGATGRTAYLQSMKVIQEIDRFAAAYAAEESPEDE